MKKIFVIIFVFAHLCNAQTFTPKNLNPITGHYKSLAALSKKAIPDTTDRQQFPLEILSPKNALKLKLKPEFLNIPVSDFKIGDFPANSSAQTKAEFEHLLKIQANERTDEKVKESLAFADVYYDVFVKPGDAKYEIMQQNLFHMGRQLPHFNPTELPITAKLMTRVWSDLTYYFWALKFQYNRTRPYMLDAWIKNLNDTKFQAYPSGHASASYVAAYVYAELIPSSSALFTKNAYDMGYSREILGVHYPSDTEAGRVFAR